MAIIDLVRWVPDGGEPIYAWRFPQTNLSTYTQLIVQESQEAVLFSKGQIMGKFGPGKHTLDTENLPILRHLFGIPFGGRNPFTAEVWFVNKLQPYNIGWNIDRINIHDVDYNTQLPLVASGQYGLRIIDSEQFLVKIVGSKSEFTASDLTLQFAGEFSTKTKSTIVQYMLKHRVGFKQISAYLDTISDYLRNVMNPFWNELGLELTKFYVNTIEIDDSTEDGRRIKDAISRQSSMSITGHTWQQEQMFETANNMLGGLGGNSGNGGLLGGLLAINMMGSMSGMGGVGNSMMQPQYNQPAMDGSRQVGNMQQGGTFGQAAGAQSVKMVYCSNCAQKYPSTMKFCPHCGDPYNPCPNCGTDNDMNARRCVSCGTYLQTDTALCPNCHNPVAHGSLFCGSCGHQLVASNVCTRCGCTLPDSVKFCPNCGNRR